MSIIHITLRGYNSIIECTGTWMQRGQSAEDISEMTSLQFCNKSSFYLSCIVFIYPLYTAST